MDAPQLEDGGGGGATFQSPPPPGPFIPIRRATVTQTAAVSPLLYTKVHRESGVSLPDDASPDTFATVATPERISRIPSPAKRPTLVSSLFGTNHIDSATAATIRPPPRPGTMGPPPTWTAPTSASSAKQRSPLVRSHSNMDALAFQRKPSTPAKAPSLHAMSDGNTSDGGSESSRLSGNDDRTAPTPTSPPPSKLRYPLRKKESLPPPPVVPSSPASKRLGKTTSFSLPKGKHLFATTNTPNTPHPSPDKATDVRQTRMKEVDGESALMLGQRLEQLLDEKEQVELDHSDLLWKNTQVQVELQQERQARADDRAATAAVVAQLKDDVERQTHVATEWEAKYREMAANYNAHAITMAEFEEKESEVRRLWDTVDAMAGQLEAIATLSGARAETQTCAVDVMQTVVETKSRELETLRGALYETVTLCFLHELAQGHDQRVLHTFLGSLGSDAAAFAWIQDRFCNKIIDEGPFSKLQNSVGTIAIHPGASQIQAGIVPPDGDEGAGLVLPTLQFSMCKKALLAQGESFECVEQANGVHAISLGDWKSRRRSLIEHTNMKSMFTSVFEQLGVCPTKYKVVVVHKPLLTPRDKAALTAMLLQDFGVAALLLTSTAHMVLHMAGLKTGIVVDVGADTTYIVPVYDDRIVQHAVVQLNVGGKMIVDHLVALFRASTPPFAALSADLQTQLALAILQTKAHVAYDYDKSCLDLTEPPLAFEIKKDKSAWLLHARVELFQGPEMLFQPALFPHGMIVHGKTMHCIDLCDPFVRDELLGAVVLSGRVTKLPGLKRRLVKEMVLARHDLLGKLHVDAPEHTEFQAYWGACTFAKFTSEDQWLLD
ncbi:Aste57867_5057 [Aphanomyces stellatus]|uniref:Aste57867_5057 protein n=1 Tax=Aphanomyces stellatus TaxID=120398 RepID=A0A485KCU3_9STRA|nr:hypothetical protein As57867_005044 [Aphanomyces stellatus]VFT82138.1 Aste57867_5057 [Aphanomyces stellatus]